MRPGARRWLALDAMWEIVPTQTRHPHGLALRFAF
jgi:hypothetical protein